jgi:hypothetical protein
MPTPTPQQLLLTERAKRTKAEERLTAAAQDRMVLLGQLKASQLLERSSIRELLRDLGSRIEGLQTALGVLAVATEQIDTVTDAHAVLAAVHAELDEDVQTLVTPAAATLSAAVLALSALTADLATLQTVASEAVGRWRVMPKKERDDLAASE